MTVLGYWTIVFGLVASILSVYYYYTTATTKTIATARARRFVKLSAALIVLASAFLLTLLLQHDFSNGYVYSYSSRSLPLHFLISSFYAGQEGSFLFWVLCSTVISIFLMRFTAKRKSEPWVMTVFMSTQVFLLLLLTVKTPFQYVWEMFPQAAANQIPADGRGLNPLLQNFWMVAHPPVLFIGFAAMAVPFSFAVGALWKKQFSLMSEQTFPWLLFASLVLGLGIMLGAYWAYGVLGWGGYWGWDPVENSSLIPWLTSVALIHTMLAERKANKFVRTNFALAIASFLLVVYSTFLTRSGILGDSSVHSFVDPGATVILATRRISHSHRRYRVRHDVPTTSGIEAGCWQLQTPDEGEYAGSGRNCDYPECGGDPVRNEPPNYRNNNRRAGFLRRNKSPYCNRHRVADRVQSVHSMGN